MKRIWLILLLTVVLALSVSIPAAASDIPDQDRGEADCAEVPALIAAEPAAGGVTVSWNAYPGAAGYRLYLYSGDEWIALCDTDATSYLHSGLSSNTAYRYTVQALNGDGEPCSDFDPAGLTLTYFSAPVLSRVTNEFGGQRVSWAQVPGAESYQVCCMTDGGWRALGVTTALSYLNTDVESDVTYTYTVRCCTADGGQLLSVYDPVGIAAHYVAAPVLTSCTPVSGGWRMTWTASPGASKYRLYTRNTGGAGWTRVAECTATTYTHTGLTDQTTYTYTVRAFNAAGEAVSSYDPSGTTLTYRDTPAMQKATNVYGGQRVSWTAIEGAEAYKVYVKTDGSWHSIGTATEPVFVNEDVEPGVTYTYTVRCCAADGVQTQSCFDTKGAAATYYPAPEIVGFTPTDGGCEVSWTAVEGVARYRLFYMTDSGWKGIATTDATSLCHQGLSDREVCAYTVRAMNAAGEFITGYHPTGWEHTYYAPPGIVGVGYEDGVYNIYWDADADAGGYELYRRALGCEWELLCTIADPAQNACADADTEPGVPYTYTLRLLGADGEPISVMLCDTLYYIDGALAEGELSCGDTVLHFENGHIRQGYVTVDDRLYYYDSSGVLMKNAVVGSADEGYTYADENGVCCTSEEIRLAAKFMMEHADGDTLEERMKTGYLYLAHHFPYNRTYDHPSKAEDMPALAIDMFTNEKGNCYRYAACFTCLAKIAGYRARVVIGTTSGNPHGWVEVLVDGEWLICDPDAEIPKYQNPDYTAYMMKQHYWQTTPKTRCELIIDENGVATWV